MQVVFWTLLAVFFPTWLPVARRHIESLNFLADELQAGRLDDY